MTAVVFSHIYPQDVALPSFIAVD